MANLAKDKVGGHNELGEIRRRAEETELRARDVEAQVRLVEARLRLRDVHERAREMLSKEPTGSTGR